MRRSSLSIFLTARSRNESGGSRTGAMVCLFADFASVMNELRHAKHETPSKGMSTSLYILTRKPGDEFHPSKDKAPCRLAPA